MPCFLRPWKGKAAREMEAVGGMNLGKLPGEGFPVAGSHCSWPSPRHLAPLPTQQPESPLLQLLTRRAAERREMAAPGDAGTLRENCSHSTQTMLRASKLCACPASAPNPCLVSSSFTNHTALVPSGVKTISSHEKSRV